MPSLHLPFVSVLTLCIHGHVAFFVCCISEYFCFLIQSSGFGLSFSAKGGRMT